jgi:hypothetical protein
MRLGRKLAEGFAVDTAIDSAAEAGAERPVPAVPDAAAEPVEVTVASDAPQERPLPV